MVEFPGNAYDEVLYPSALYSQTHPDRLATVATLLGMKPAPVERCRVLELGCGDGVNLIAMAYGLPESEFVGIDLAERPIAKGNVIVGQLKLGNILLSRMDVGDAASELGRFDYIIAHGLYSWVPAQIRDRVMEFCGRSLTENGVAYISYNAYPGNHLRDLVRGMMRYHAAHFSQPELQIRQARALVKLLAESGEKPDAYQQILQRELERITKYTDAGFFHDDLSAMNQPVYFHEFMAHARRHDLQFLAEADLTDMAEDDGPPQVKAALRELDPNDVIGREQYRDFFRCRAFRQTLLCRGEVPLDRALRPDRVSSLYVSGEIRCDAASREISFPTAAVFLGPKNSEVETDRPPVKTAFARLGEAWPRRIHFRELLAHSRSRLGRIGDEQVQSDTEDLSASLLQACLAGFLELHAHIPRLTMEPGEHPIASALARLQLESGDKAATLLHGIVRVENDLGRELLKLMDGTRNRAALCEALEQSIMNGKVTFLHEGKPATDPAVIRRMVADGLDENLRKLARLALLVG